jgi:3-methyladenine DNA glycosylase AlkC
MEEDKARILDLRFARLVSGFAPEEQRDMVWVIDTKSDADVRGYETFKDIYFKGVWENYIMEKYVKRLDDGSEDNPATVASNIVALKRQFEEAWHTKHDYRLSDAVNAAAFSIINEIFVRDIPGASSVDTELVYMYLRRANRHYSLFAAVVGTRMNSEYFSRMVYKPSAKLSGSRSYMQGNSAARSALRQVVLFKLYLKKNVHNIIQDLKKITNYRQSQHAVAESDAGDGPVVWCAKHNEILTPPVFSYDLFRPNFPSAHAVGAQDPAGNYDDPSNARLNGIVRRGNM